MDSKIKLLIADASRDYLMLLQSALEEEEDVAVLGAFTNGAEVWELLERETPDVLVTDLLLPGLDGLSIIRMLREEERLPHTVVVSAFVNQHMARELSRLGVDDYLPKPCELTRLVRRIRETVDPKTRRKVHNFDPAIQLALSHFGISPHLHGRRYLAQAVLMALQDPSVIHGITKVLYPELGRYFHTAAPCIERSIRSSILRAWQSHSPEERSHWFGTTFEGLDKAPSNGRFIAAIVEHIELGYEEENVWNAP